MTDFDFGSLLPKRGAFKSLSFEVIRELEPDDILRVGSGSLLSHPPLQKIRAIHHRIAQLIGQGFTYMEIAEMVGSSYQRITKLVVDPTFMELVSYYQEQISEKAIEDGQRIKSKLKVISETALDELTDRMMDDERRTEMPTSELRKIVELGADRTVAPPMASVHMTQAPQAITLNIGAPRFQETNTPKTIEHMREETEHKGSKAKNVDNEDAGEEGDEGAEE